MGRKKRSAKTDQRGNEKKEVCAQAMQKTIIGMANPPFVLFHPIIQKIACLCNGF